MPSELPRMTFRYLGGGDQRKDYQAAAKSLGVTANEYINGMVEAARRAGLAPIAFWIDAQEVDRQPVVIEEKKVAPPERDEKPAPAVRIVQPPARSAQPVKEMYRCSNPECAKSVYLAVDEPDKKCLWCKSSISA